MSDDDYDIIIDINSIRFLKKRGWRIIYSKDKEDEMKQIIKFAKKNIVSILGHSNRGKTYILQRLSDVKLQSGYQIHTKGISIKIPEDQNILILDTQGTNAPLLLEDGEEDKRKDPNFIKELEDINLCQIITNYLIQTFIIKEAHTLICVVGMLTSSETIFLNKIKKNCRDKKQLLVIHNLINCHSKRDIEKYKKEILLNNIIIKFEERVIPSFDDDRNDNFNKYYVELDDDNKDFQNDVLHFILGNDNEEEIKYYNESTIKYIQDYIDIKINENINIIEKLTEHINNLSSLVLKKPIEATPNENFDLIECDKEIEPKEIIADELDNITFIGNYYEPPYRCYKKEDKFIIEVDICSKLKDKTLSIIHFSDKENNELEIFRIKGERLLVGEEKNEKKKIIYNFTNKRANAKLFELNFKINLSEKGVISISGNNESFINKGILYISFDIIN
jgi:hypothetical protein